MLFNDKYEILTKEGFCDFVGVKTTTVSSHYAVTFADGTILKCSLTHEFDTTIGKISISGITKEHEIITETGLVSVESKEFIDGEIELYDIVHVDNSDHTFYANSISVSNCSWIRNFNEFWASTYPTISSGTETKVIMTSTPNGMNHWWKLFTDAQNKKNDFHPIEISWQRVPGRDEKWKEETIKNTSEEQFQQEHECAFLGSSNTLIAGWKLAVLRGQDPLEHNKEFGLRVYERPKKNHRYVITVDVAQGVEKDSSCFSVFDITLQPFVQVVAFNNNKIFSHELSEILSRIGKQYNDAYVMIELNDLGREVANLMKFDFDYENLIHSVSQGRKGITLTFANGNALPGLRTTTTTKRVGCSNLKNLIESDRLLLRDQMTIEELFHFVSDGKNFSAEENFHDDHAMTLVLFGFMSNSKIFPMLHGDYSRPSEYEGDDFNFTHIRTEETYGKTWVKHDGDVWEELPIGAMF